MLWMWFSLLAFCRSFVSTSEDWLLSWSYQAYLRIILHFTFLYISFYISLDNFVAYTLALFNLLIVLGSPDFGKEILCSYAQFQLSLLSVSWLPCACDYKETTFCCLKHLLWWIILNITVIDIHDFVIQNLHYDIKQLVHKFLVNSSTFLLPSAFWQAMA